MGFLSQSDLMLSPFIKLTRKAVDTTLQCLLLELSLSFRNKHLLGHRELPDNVVIRILARGLDLYFRAIEEGSFTSHAVVGMNSW